MEGLAIMVWKWEGSETKSPITAAITFLADAAKLKMKNGGKQN